MFVPVCWSRKRYVFADAIGEVRRRMDRQERWLSVAEIAEHIGIKQETVYTWVAQQGLPAHKVGRLWKFDRKEVDDWVRSGRAAAKKRQRRPPTSSPCKRKRGA